MNEQIYISAAYKFLELCDCDKGAVIYSLLPLIDAKNFDSNSAGMGCVCRGGSNILFSHALANQPALLSSALEIFTSKRSELARTSYAYKRISEEKESFLNILSQTDSWLDLPDKISDDSVAAALSLISHSYVESLFNPIQFFLPHSSSCSGQWEFWDMVDYISLREKINIKENAFNLRDHILKSSVWKTKFKPEEFPLIVQRRLSKENLFDKSLNTESMVKAMIIRIGELARPFVNYEIIDYSIRSFFTYLGVKNYLRVDREIEFLRRFEKEVENILKGI